MNPENFAYIVPIISFAIGVFSIPYVQTFITPYLANYAWATVPASYIIAGALAMYILPRLIYSLLGQLLS